MRIQSVSSAFVKGLGSGYTKLSIDDLVKMRIHGVRRVHSRAKGLNCGSLPSERLVQFQDHHGVDGDFIRDVQKADE